MSAYRGAYRYRSPYRRRAGAPGMVAVVAVAAAAAAGTGAHAVVTRAKPHGQAQVQPARAAVAVTGGSEAAFMDAVLADLGAPATAADTGSLADWAAREGPWGSVGRYNPLDTTMTEPGSWAFNTFDGDLHVQSYPTAAEGAQATAATLEGGYPLITAALRSGAGLCGDPEVGDELLTWSGNGYSEVC